MLMTSNVHQREYRATPEAVGALLDTVAGPDDRVWPLAWPQIGFDRPLRPGANGGHGPIRYAVADYEPGRRIMFRFAPSFALTGTHELEVLPGTRAGGSVLRHAIVARPASTLVRLLFPVTVEKLHDALIEDLLDRVGTELGEPPARPARWSPRVRLLRRLDGLRRLVLARLT